MDDLTNINHILTIFEYIISRGEKMASSHYCDEVLDFIRNNNKDPKHATIISALVDEGLTPIIQVPDVAVNKTFKQKLKDRYYQHR
ncbi:MAG: hypothetical protein ACK53Y_02235, partial [bacterium]